MKTYTVTMANGYVWTMIADMSNAAGYLEAAFKLDGSYDYTQPTPYQTADARHDAERAAKMVWDYFADDAAERSIEVASVE